MPPKLKAKEKTPETQEETTLESDQGHFSRAANVIIQLVIMFDSDPDYEFQQKDLDALFQGDTLAPYRMTSQRWNFLFDALRATTRIEDESFPLVDFIDLIIETEGLQPKTSKFFSEFKARLINSTTRKSTPQQTFSLKSGFSEAKASAKKQLFGKNESDEETESNRFQPKFNDRRAKINISISLPQYDGKQGKAAKFVTKFTQLMENQRYDQDEWDALLMDCLKKEALKHFEGTRDSFNNCTDYLNDLITFFDRRSINDQKKWYRDTFRQ